MSTKHFREMSKLAKSWGRVAVLSKRNGHIHLVCKRGVRPLVVVSGSPSCCRELKNTIRDLRKADR